MRIKGQEVPVDFLTELEPYLDNFRDRKRVGDKLQSCSPFRYERHPSFAVNLDNGTWIDSGSPTERYHKGNFVALLSYLRQEEYPDTENYLMTAYHIMLADVDGLALKIDLEPPSPPKVFSWKEDCKHLHYRHPYLGRRGISEKIQKLFLVGYDKELDAVAMPWISTNKDIINIKYRCTKGKHFFYEQEGQLTRNYLYGLAQVIHFGHKTVAIVESEIDCMYLWTNDIPAVATGNSGISKAQTKLLLKAGVDTIIAASDNDDAGNRFRENIQKYLTAHFIVKDISIPYGYKDVNDLPPKLLLEVFTNMETCGILFNIVE